MLRGLMQKRSAFDEPNEYRVLRTVRDSSPISRTEISHLCRLSKTTVTEITSRFIEEGFLQFVGSGASTKRGGRKRELLKFNAAAGRVIGVDIRMRSAHAVVTDLNADILKRTLIEYPAGSEPSAVFGALADVITEWKREDPNITSKGVGVGVGLPGLIDPVSGIVRVADTLKGWAHADVKGFFEDLLGLTTYVENDVKAMALGEYLFGVGKHVPDQVFFWIGDGIGAGIIVNGSLLHGCTSSAGEVGYNELGHALARPGVFPLLFENQKDFGEILSDASIVRAYRRAGGQSPMPDAAALVQVAQQGEPLAEAVLDEATSLIAIMCINVVNMLNPRMIVLGGEIARSPGVIERVQQKLRADLLTEPAQAVTVRASGLRKDGVLLGAVGLVLYDLFKPSHVLASAEASVNELISI